MLFRNRKILYLSLLMIGVVLNFLSSLYLTNIYREHSSTYDLLLNLVDGDYLWTMKIAEVIITLNLIIFCIFYFKERRDINKLLFVFSTFFLLRALLLPLTVINHLQSGSFLNDFKIIQFGLFPSGHTAVMFIIVLFSKNKLFYNSLISLFLVMYLLVLGKQHYSIDIITSLFVVYSIKAFYERNLENVH